MSIVYVLLPLSILLGSLFLAAYWWSLRTNQFEDLDTPSLRILADEDSKDGGESGKHN